MKEKMMFSPEDEGRLSEEAAQEEANMMRVKMGVVPETGKLEQERWDKESEDYVDVGKETTTEDYDRVFEKLEELRAEAAEEMTMERVINKLRDFPMLKTEIIDRLYLGTKEGPVRDASDVYLDAESALKSLRDSAKRFGRRELEELKKNELRQKIQSASVEKAEEE